MVANMMYRIEASREDSDGKLWTVVIKDDEGRDVGSPLIGCRQKDIVPLACDAISIRQNVEPDSIDFEYTFD